MFLALLVAPIASAQSATILDRTDMIEAHHYEAWEIPMQLSGANFTLTFRANPCVDVFLFDDKNYAAYQANQAVDDAGVWLHCARNVTTTFTIPRNASRVLVLDNTEKYGYGEANDAAYTLRVDRTPHAPPGQAAPTTRATPTPAQVEVPIAAPKSSDLTNGTALEGLDEYAEGRFLWIQRPTLGIAFITLAQLALLVLCLPRARLGSVAGWTLAIAAVAYIFSESHVEGILLHVGPPSLLGLVYAHRVHDQLRQDDDPHATLDGLRAAYFVTFLGTLLGADLARVALDDALLKIEPGTFLVIGGAYWRDALVLVPALSMLYFAAGAAWSLVSRTE